MRNARVFEDQCPLPFVLEEEDPLFSVWPIRVFDPFNEKCSLLIVEPDVAVDHLWQANRSVFASSLLSKDIDDLLGKGLEEHGSRSASVRDDDVYRLRPCTPVVLLSLRPVVHEQVQATELLLGILFKLPERSLRFIPRKYSRSPLVFVITGAHGFP